VRRPSQSAAEFVAVLAGSALGVSEAEIASFWLSGDSLDIVELMMELEELCV
jgi:acyl carrier protein